MTYYILYFLVLAGNLGAYYLLNKLATEVLHIRKSLNNLMILEAERQKENNIANL
jgi:hypothetical protein